MIIRAKNFRSWFKNNLKEEARDIAEHGADKGFPYITYFSDAVKLFDKFEDEIWEMAVEDAEDCGYKNVAEFISRFGRADMMDNVHGFKNLMVWYACEKVARELTEEVR